MLGIKCCNVEEVNWILSELLLISHKRLKSFSEAVQHQGGDGAAAGVCCVNSVELGVMVPMKVVHAVIRVVETH